LACAIHCRTLIVVLVLASLIFLAAAVRALGKQWSLQARVLEHHELIGNGPYRIVRHPIYTGMFGLLVAGSLAYGQWLGLLIGSAVYCAGTIIRIRSEEKLLREQFGSAYEEYAREVPAFIPFGGTRAVVSKKPSLTSCRGSTESRPTNTCLRNLTGGLAIIA
jgi:protein-S-isoprenylcysteine O-methyltransferase Ste14